MSTMRAAVLREFGQLTVGEVERPEPGPGEVLVRVRACGICGTDLKIVNGAYQGTWPPALPFIIGHEWSGEVAALGGLTVFRMFVTSLWAALSASRDRAWTTI